MLNNSKKRKIAKKIAALERIIDFNKDPKAVESAQTQLQEVVAKYNLTLGDLLDLDDMILKILGE